VKHPMTPEEYEEVIRILNEQGLLNPLLPLQWDAWHPNEQQCLYEAFEYMVGPYEKDLMAKGVSDDE